VNDPDGAYDYLGALDELTPWDSLTPDRQAEFAKLIGMAQDIAPGGAVDRRTLGRAIKEDRELATAPNVTQAQRSNLCPMCRAFRTVTPWRGTQTVPECILRTLR